MTNWLEELGLAQKLEEDPEVLENLSAISDIIQTLKDLSKEELINNLRRFKRRSKDEIEIERIRRNTIYIGEYRELCKKIGVDYLDNNALLKIQVALYSFLIKKPK